MDKNHTIISFEGLDCSFKETNYEKFTFKLIEQRQGIFQIHKESFPRYGNWSAMALERWLNGSFDRQMLKNHPEAVNSMYCIDRFAYWYEADENGKRRIELLKNNNDSAYHYFVFDRYTLSNPIYNPICPEAISMEDFGFDEKYYGIPNPDVTVWMRMNNFDVLLDLISKKNNKDANETDIEFLRKSWERSENIISSDIFDKIGTKLVVIECLNNDGSIKNRNDIADYIWETVLKSI